ncbi:MAG: hypothetical protein KAY32_01670 [Candidatus Eisenbacteria sp.]|nr:hypothetical protein [Candidatus Eisenbacteria bacterium]
MDCPQGDRAVVQALRLGLEPERIEQMVTPVTIEPETLIIRSASADPVPLLLCLHPSRLCEFQCAQKLRDLEQLAAHIAFPRGLHAREVDLGGARTVGYAWYQYTGDNPAFRQSLSAAAAYLDAVLARLREQLALQDERFYVIGIEDAAMLAIIFALRHAPHCAAVAAIDGQLHPEVIDEFTGAAESLPLLRMRHRIPTPRGEQAAESEALRALGLSIDEQIVHTYEKRWEEEAGMLISWLSQSAGLTVTGDGDASTAVAVDASSPHGLGGFESS